MTLTHTCRAPLNTRGLFFLVAVLLIGWGQILQPQAPAPIQSTVTSSSSPENNNGDLKDDMNSCRVHRVTSLPGSHQFASDFIEAIASDPDPGAKDPEVIWGLTADLSTDVPFQDRALYISKSTNGGATWTQVARGDSRYFE